MGYQWFTCGYWHWVLVCHRDTLAAAWLVTCIPEFSAKVSTIYQAHTDTIQYVHMKQWHLTNSIFPCTYFINLVTRSTSVVHPQIATCVNHNGYYGSLWIGPQLPSPFVLGCMVTSMMTIKSPMAKCPKLCKGNNAIDIYYCLMVQNKLACCVRLSSGSGSARLHCLKWLIKLCMASVQLNIIKI